MVKSGKNHLISFRRLLLISLGLSIFALIEKFPTYYGMGSLLGHFSGSRLLQMSPVFLVAFIDVAFLFLSYRDIRTRILGFITSTVLVLKKLGILNWVIFSCLALVFPVLVLTNVLSGFDAILSRIWIFGHLILLGSLFLRAKISLLDDLMVVILSALTFAVVERFALFIPDISNQMTSLGWSEASRYYYASLFFSKSVYGIAAPLPSLHPSRYLLQSIPFVIPNLPLWVHRAWQVFLWISLSMTTSYIVIRRLQLKSVLITIMTILWGYLFLNQGPVYYHLVICVIIVAAGFSANKPLRSLVIIILASIWAGISRINWFPVPGILGVFFYILEVPFAGKQFWRYWIWPLIWVVSGLISAFLVEAAYVIISNNPVQHFGTSFTSSLLWYRLFPNVTYPGGILLSILIVSLPVVLLLLYKFTSLKYPLHLWRIIPLTIILIVFFVGGIIVSVKIGGGSNLHNMDAFLIFLMVATVYLFFDRATAEPSMIPPHISIPWFVTALLVIVPIIAVAQADAKITRFDNAPVKADLVKLQEIIDKNSHAEGKILFISQRHFITYQYVTGVHLVPDYEKVFLMEMAMADNQAYFAQFENDLMAHRFSLIISEPLSMIIQDDQDVFAEENNAWTTHIPALIRKYYHEIMNLPNALIVVSEPISLLDK